MQTDDRNSTEKTDLYDKAPPTWSTIKLGVLADYFTCKCTERIYSWEFKPFKAVTKNQ